MAKVNRSVDDACVRILEAELAGDRQQLLAAFRAGVAAREQLGAARVDVAVRRGARRPLARALCFGKGAGWLPLIPGTLPSSDLMLDDIGASPEHLARVLGVSEGLVWQWVSGEADIPRSVDLALFWLTKWGRSAINAKAETDAAFHAGLARNLTELVERQRAQLVKLGQIGDFGSANDPSELVPVRGVAERESVAVAAEQAVRRAA